MPKKGEAVDTTGVPEEQKKVDLFTLNFGTGYNFAADSLRFSPLTSGFRASP